MFFGCHIDHVISEKHGGETLEENLAFACVYCNLHKGTDIASLLPKTGELVRLFNPRRDQWRDHFQLGPDGITILPLTPIGEVTTRTLRLNENPRLLEREALWQIGRYPTPAAKKRL
jgi:HNH endonuclease